MAGSASFIFVIVCLLQISILQCQQSVPEHCRRPPPGGERPHTCCPIPPMFSDEDFTECGFTKFGDKNGPKPRGPPDCSKQLCILKKHNLLKGNEPGFDAISNFLDKWVEENPAFEDAVAAAKKQCLLTPTPGPPGACEPNKVIFCISTTLFTECPVWQDSEGCTILKNHFEECNQYFQNKPTA